MEGRFCGCSGELLGIQQAARAEAERGAGYQGFLAVRTDLSAFHNDHFKLLLRKARPKVARFHRDSPGEGTGPTA